MRLSEITYNPRLKELLLNLPKIDCDPNCDQCCSGSIGAIITYTGSICRTENIYKEQDGICSFFTGTECEIYEDRGPFCRLFGIIWELRCPKGKQPERYLSRTQVKEIVSLWIHEQARIVKVGNNV